MLATASAQVCVPLGHSSLYLLLLLNCSLYTLANGDMHADNDSVTTAKLMNSDIT